MITTRSRMERIAQEPLIAVDESAHVAIGVAVVGRGEPTRVDVCIYQWMVLGWAGPVHYR